MGGKNTDSQSLLIERTEVDPLFSEVLNAV